MKYDDVSWHCGGQFPKDLPDEAGATHIGMFLAWTILHGLEGSLHKEHSVDSLTAVRQRRMTGAQFLLNECDWKFTDEDLDDEGNAFASSYYGNDEGYGAYVADYESTLGGDLPSLYHVADSWENYDKMAPVISQRHEAWKKQRS